MAKPSIEELKELIQLALSGGLPPPPPGYAAPNPGPDHVTEQVTIRLLAYEMSTDERLHEIFQRFVDAGKLDNHAIRGFYVTLWRAQDHAAIILRPASRPTPLNPLVRQLKGPAQDFIFNASGDYGELMHEAPAEPSRLFRFFKDAVDERLQANPIWMPPLSGTFLANALTEFYMFEELYEAAKDDWPGEVAKFLVTKRFKTRKSYRAHASLTDKLLDDYIKFHHERTEQSNEANAALAVEHQRQRKLAGDIARAKTFISNERSLEDAGKALLTATVGDDEDFLYNYLRITSRRSHIMHPRRQAARMISL